MAARSIALTWESPAFPVRVDIFRGEDITLTFTRAAATTISAWTISCAIKKFHGDSSATLTIAGSITSAASGVFTVALTAAQTAALDLQSYVFSITRTDSGSNTQMAVGYLNMLER